MHRHAANNTETDRNQHTETATWESLVTEKQKATWNNTHTVRYTTEGHTETTNTTDYKYTQFFLKLMHTN